MQKGKSQPNTNKNTPESITSSFLWSLLKREQLRTLDIPSPDNWTVLRMFWPKPYDPGRHKYWNLYQYDYPTLQYWIEICLQFTMTFENSTIVEYSEHRNEISCFN